MIEGKEIKIIFFIILSVTTIIFVSMSRDVSAIGFCTSSSAAITCCKGYTICTENGGNDQMCKPGGTVPAGNACPY